MNINCSIKSDIRILKLNYDQYRNIERNMKEKKKR